MSRPARPATVPTTDRMLRKFSVTGYARLKRAAQARGLTMAQYVEKLVQLHDAILASEQASALEEYGLGRVSD